ncbi:potassium-transporting ATPase A chain [Striga asiatica]|uniref:Potassium-transporting ATPase A chain n=1 Tax=Striga asiatica TaxID=4170 RepID=A0A5A7NZ13_STRAF|nr:potassium-transporting ATPase A chain [Striga asiatica]
MAKPRKHSPTDPKVSKFYRHFLLKSSLITVLILLLSLFPSIAPEFITRTLHAASWELLQLVFIGIAVSYGLFSRKNEQTAKPESPRVETLNSQYFRVEPVVVVTKLQQITPGKKPLFLPKPEIKINENEDIKTNSGFAANDDVAKFVGVIETSDEDNVGNNIIDVDKKADEFIAKFREQIRLQRIESI